jgi:hypothetical protein
MQIHEITLRKQQSVTEGPMFDKIKALAGGLSQDPNFARADYKTRLKILGNNRVLDTIADQAFSSWQAKHAQLVKTKGGPLAPQEAKEQVTALVKQTMLPPYTELDNLVNGQQIQQAIDGFVTAFNAGNMDVAKQAMGTLADLGAAAITTRQAQGATAPGAQQRPGAAAAPAAPGAQAQAGAQQQPAGDLRREVAQALTGVGVQNIPRQPGAVKQALSQMGANLAPRSTGDAHADSLLRLFGFEPR